MIDGPSFLSQTFPDMNANRKAAFRILDHITQKRSGLSLHDLPDLPCVMNALDEMEEIIDEQKNNSSLGFPADPKLSKELVDIAEDAVSELLEEEGMLLDEFTD